MQNFLLNSLETYFSKVLILESKLSITSNYLKEYSKQIIKEDREYKMLHSAITTYRDISLIQGGDNLFTPNYSFEMDVNRLNNQIDDIISQQGCFAVAQAYEFFETFLIDIITDYIFFNQKNLGMIGMSAGKLIMLRTTIREKVKSLKKGNKDRFSILRKSCSFFKKHEVKNIYNYNITLWFNLITLVRHDIVHNGQRASKKLMEYVRENNLEKIFNEQIETKKIDNDTSIYFKVEFAGEIINRLNGLAHLVFKSISIELGLSANVPQYVQPPLNLSKILVPSYYLKNNRLNF